MVTPDSGPLKHLTGVTVFRGSCDMLQQSREASWACSPTVKTVGIVCLRTEYHLIGISKISFNI